MVNVDSEKSDVEVSSKVVEPVGEVVVGKVDPRTLSKNEFKASSDLLFHGASEEFEFLREFDYRENFVNSRTIGEGFYATSNREDAELFSIAFRKRGETPIIAEVLPYKAKMFDFRNISDLASNAPVPQNMLDEYINYFENIYEDRYGDYDPEEDIKFINKTLPDGPDEERRKNAKSLEDYFATKPRPYSEERKKRGKRVGNFESAIGYLRILKSLPKDRTDLRQMLSLFGEARSSEYASTFFARFMLDQGYEGVIYLEGGDHPDHKNPTSYVFFNLDKIGTYETWHNETGEISKDSLD